MKFIHTADLHLDSPLSGVSDSTGRRAELFKAFCNMVDYAKRNGISTVVVAGDMFDGDYTLPATVANVAEVISQSGLTWIVLRGNHASTKPYDILYKLAPNVCLFCDNWTSFDVENATFCGRELGVNDEAEWNNLQLDASRFNVLVLHGDVDSDAYGFIDKRAIAASGASYVALGHRHTYAEHKFGKVAGAYSGVLETRGFDENAETGFVVVDTETHEREFVKQHIRKVVTVEIDVTGVQNDVQLENRLEKQLQDVAEKHYVNVKYVGTLHDGVKLGSAETYLKNKFYAVRTEDCTTDEIDLSKLSAEISLRGEFVKLAMEIADEKTRKSVISYGLKALDGTEDL